MKSVRSVGVDVPGRAITMPQWQGHVPCRSNAPRRMPNHKVLWAFCLNATTVSRWPQACPVCARPAVTPEADKTAVGPRPAVQRAGCWAAGRPARGAVSG